jgi:hypothetical protein
MFEWLIFLSQLALWALVINLYRTRNRTAASAQPPFETADSPTIPADYDWEKVMFAPGAFVAPATSLESPELERINAQLQTLVERLGPAAPEPASTTVSTFNTSAAPSPLLRGYGQAAATPASSQRAPAEIAAERMPDIETIARNTGRQREEVGLLLHMARRAEGKES